MVSSSGGWSVPYGGAPGVFLEERPSGRATMTKERIGATYVDLREA
jgi:hypothetical protein